MADDVCAACGKPITTVRASNRIITLERVWVHYSWWANRSHRAIPARRWGDQAVR